MDGGFDMSSLLPILSPRNGWSPQETWIFAKNLQDFTSDLQGFLDHVGVQLPFKSIDEIITRYNETIEEVDKFSASLIADDDTCKSTMKEAEGVGAEIMKSVIKGKTYKRKKIQRKPWTVEEHRLFLKGLESFQKRDYMSISKYMIGTKTPSQVASHANQYFHRQTIAPFTRRRRRSIHDITTADSFTAPLLLEGPTNYLQANIGVVLKEGTQNNIIGGVHCQSFPIENDFTTNILLGKNNLEEDARWKILTEKEVLTNHVTNYGVAPTIADSSMAPLLLEGPTNYGVALNTGVVLTGTQNCTLGGFHSQYFPNVNDFTTNFQLQKNNLEGRKKTMTGKEVMPNSMTNNGVVLTTAKSFMAPILFEGPTNSLQDNFGVVLKDRGESKNLTENEVLTNPLTSYGVNLTTADASMATLFLEGPTNYGRALNTEIVLTGTQNSILEGVQPQSFSVANDITTNFQLQKNDLEAGRKSMTENEVMTNSVTNNGVVLTTVNSFMAPLLLEGPTNYLQANVGVVLEDRGEFKNLTENEALTNPLTNYGALPYRQTNTEIRKNQIKNFNPVANNAFPSYYPTLRDLVELAKLEGNPFSSFMW